jgi:hypothetical protein
MYLPIRQSNDQGFYRVVRSSQAPSTLAPALSVLTPFAADLGASQIRVLRGSAS